MQTRSQAKRKAKEVQKKLSPVFSVLVEVSPPTDQSIATSVNMGSTSKCEVSAVSKLKSFVSNVTNRKCNENIMPSVSDQDLSRPPSISPSAITSESTANTSETSAMVTQAQATIISKSFVSRFTNNIGQSIMFAVRSIPSILGSISGLYAIYQMYRMYYNITNEIEKQDEKQDDYFEILLKKRRF